MAPREKNAPKKKKSADSTSRERIAFVLNVTSKGQKKNKKKTPKKRKEKENVSVHVSDAAGSKWKLMSSQTLAHVTDIVKTVSVTTVNRAKKRDRVAVAEMLDKFSTRFLKDLARQKVPSKRLEPYSQNRKNTDRCDQLLKSAKNRLEKLEEEMSQCEKEIERMENYLADEPDERETLPPLFTQLENKLELASLPSETGSSSP